MSRRVAEADWFARCILGLLAVAIVGWTMSEFFHRVPAPRCGMTPCVVSR